MKNKDIIREGRTPRMDADELGDVTSGWDTSTPDQILGNLETWKNLVQNEKGFLGDSDPLTVRNVKKYSKKCINCKQTKQEILMEYIKTEVKHSLSKTAWNVVGTQLGRKYKIARVPYLVIERDEILTTRNKHEALEHALFISKCFNEKHGV